MLSCCHAALIYKYLRCYGCTSAVYVIHLKSERNTGNLCVWSYSLPPADGLCGQECKRCRSFTFLVALFTFLTALAISRRQRIRSNAKVSCKTKCGCVDTFAECLHGDVELGETRRYINKFLSWILKKNLQAISSYQACICYCWQTRISVKTSCFFTSLSFHVGTSRSDNISRKERGVKKRDNSHLDWSGKWGAKHV